MIYVNRSIPLSQESRDGWKNTGAICLSRNTKRRSSQLHAVQESDTLVNLGLAQVVPFCGTVYNERNSVLAVITPGAIRRTIPDLIPPHPAIGDDYWYKGPGYGGKNKIRETAVNENDINFLDVQPNWDLQKHIEGVEYRVVTVGNVVVQAHRKTVVSSGYPPLPNIPLEFEWSWVGVKGIADSGLISLVKKAVALVPGGNLSVFGWDCILGEAGAYIIEGNSSPGVNDATAERIVRQIGVANA